MVVSMICLVVIAYVGFRLLKSLLKGLVLGVGIALGLTAAWMAGLLPRDTPSAVERTGAKVQEGVERLGDAVNTGAKEAVSEAKETTRKVERSTTKAVKSVTNEVGQAMETAKDEVHGALTPTAK